jgi:hypothetical protein
LFEKRKLRRLFWLKRDVVTGGWRVLHNEELPYLYSSPSIIRVIQLRRNAYRILVGKARRKETTRKTKKMWVDYIKIYLREIRWGWYGLN